MKAQRKEIREKKERSGGGESGGGQYQKDKKGTKGKERKSKREKKFFLRERTGEKNYKGVRCVTELKSRGRRVLVGADSWRG